MAILDNKGNSWTTSKALVNTSTNWCVQQSCPKQNNNQALDVWCVHETLDWWQCELLLGYHRKAEHELRERLENPLGAD